MDRDRLEYLISGFCDRILSESETVELNAFLAVSEDARRQFVILVDQHRQLCEWHAAGSAAGSRLAREARVLESPDAFMRALMVRYLEGSLDGLGTEALQVLLREDAGARAEFSQLAEQRGTPQELDEKPVLRMPAGSGISRAIGSSARRRSVQAGEDVPPPSAFSAKVWVAAAAVFLLSVLGGVLWWSLWLPPTETRHGSLKTERVFAPPDLPSEPLPPPRPQPPEPGKEEWVPFSPVRSVPVPDRAAEEEHRKKEAEEFQRLMKSQERWLTADLPRARPNAQRGPLDDEESVESVDVPAPEVTHSAEAVPVGRVVFVEAEVRNAVVVRKDAGAETRLPLTEGSVLLAGDRVETQRLDERPCAALRLEGGATIDLGGETTMEVKGVGAVRLECGRVYACFKKDWRDEDQYGSSFLLETSAGRYLSEDVRMEVSASPVISVPAKTVAKVDTGRVHLFNEKGHVMGFRGQEVQSVAQREPVSLPSQSSAVWRGRDLPLDSLPCGLQNGLVVLDEDPLSCLLQDYALALSHDGSRNVYALGAGGNGNARDRSTELARHVQALKARGLQNAPAVLQGCDHPLQAPASGRDEDARAVPSPVARKLVELAKRATPDGSVVVVCAGSMTEVASAWLLDRTCADRLIVVCGYGDQYRCQQLDPWAYGLVMRRFRCIVLPKTHVLGLAAERFARVSDPKWQLLPPKENSRDVVLLASVVLPGFAVKVERSVCVQDGLGAFHFEPFAKGRIWMIKSVNQDLLKRELEQTFFSE